MPGRSSVIVEVSRREVLGWGVAAAAVGVMASPACASPIAGVADLRVLPKIAMIDMELAVPQSYFAAITHQAKHTIPFRGDVAAQWYGRLDRTLDPRSAIIGLTTAGSLFCFEELCAHRGFKLIAAMHHDVFRRSPGFGAGSQQLEAEEAHRIARLARGVSPVPLAGSPLARFAKVDRTIPVSWVIAPAALDSNRMAAYGHNGKALKS